MTFLIWDNQTDAEASLVAVNDVYGCPYVAENGYRMDQWDFVIKSYVSDDHGFFTPEERLGMEMDDLMLALVPGFTEHEEMPEEFESEEEEI